MSVELTDEQAKATRNCLENCVKNNGINVNAHKKLIKLLTPKLAEPKNFGAIVKDEDGMFWVLTIPKEWRNGKAWFCEWSDIENPTLIFEGVKE